MLHSSERCSYALQVDHNDKENLALNAFNQLWKTQFAKDSLLVFSTGRSHALYSELRVSSFPTASCRFQAYCIMLISDLMCAFTYGGNLIYC